MAWLELEPSGQYHVAFRYGTQKFKRSLRTKRKREAEQLLGRIDRRLQLLEAGDIEFPENVDLPTFLMTNGKRSKPVELQTARTLKELFKLYLDAIEHGAMESNSRKTLKTHLKHLERLLGARLAPDSINVDHLQKYIDGRRKEPGLRGRPVSPTTIRKELTSLSGVWKWSRLRNLVTKPFPNVGLSYPKGNEKPPFMTQGEILREIERGGLSDAKIADLWDCLYLRPAEVADVLEFARENARHSFLFPMIFTAAHTGARRSELIRSELGDLDLDAKTIRIRERKRDRRKHTYRTIPVSPLLSAALANWLSEHPGGRQLFCLEKFVLRSSKDRTAPIPLTVDEATDHFRRTFAASKWKVIRGWHVFRHSFASNCASAGVDQRLINEWMGHQTEEMVKRYRHLCPNVQAQALAHVYGCAAEAAL